MKAKIYSLKTRAINSYSRYQKYLPAVFFFSGFTWDSLTLNRIDRLSDNLILLAYLLLAGAAIILMNYRQNGSFRIRKLEDLRQWYPLAAQFFFGGLFSSYVVFYFQSASFTKTSVFLLLLIILLIANEFVEKRISNIYLQIVFYFLAAFAFFTFFIPVVLKIMNQFTFLLSGILSLSIIYGLLVLFHKKFNIMNKQQFNRSFGIVFLLYLLLNLFYSLNWIPPVPLSLKESGIYRQVERQGDDFILKMKNPEWYQFWKKSENPFQYAEGDTVFSYASVFAPTQLKKKIFHHWEYFSPQNEAWLTTDKLIYEVTGGRRGGYRGYTYKTNVVPGKWRVNVKTGDNLLLGRINFEIIAVADKVTDLKILEK